MRPAEGMPHLRNMLAPQHLALQILVISVPCGIEYHPCEW